MKLRTRLLIIALAGTLASALGVAIGNSYFSRSAILEQLEGDIAQIGGDVSQKVGRWMADRKTDMAAWSADGIYGNASKDGFVAKSARRAASERLTGLQSGYGYFESLSLATLDGTVVSSSNESAVEAPAGVDLSAFQALEPGQTLIGPVQDTTGQPFVLVGAQIFVKETPMGVLFGKVDLETISNEFFQNLALGDGNRVFLTDASGIVVASGSDDGSVGKSLLSLNGGQSIPIGEVVRVQAGDGSHMGVQMPVGDLSWNLQVDAKTSVALRDVTMLLIVSMVVAAVIFAVVAIALQIILTRITAPLLQLTEDTKGLAAGDYATVISATERADEIGEIAKCLDDFRKSLAELGKMEEQRAAMNAEQSSIVEKLSTSLAQLANGDLTSKISGVFPDAYDQLRVDYNAAVDRLHSAVSRVVSTSEEIDKDVQQISSATADFTGRAHVQSTTLAETAASLDELTASMSEATDGVQKARDTVAGAQERAQQSGAVMADAMETMEGIRKASDEVAKITSTIDEIAFQTNLLALNAGVEAARAGEAGRGFAVVASEVRALSQRCSEAASDINSLIEMSGKQVKRGVELVGETGTELEHIVATISEITNLMDEVAQSSKAQSSGLNHINGSIGGLDHENKRNVAMFEETTQASKALAKEAASLVEATRAFEIYEGTKVTPLRQVV